MTSLEVKIPRSAGGAAVVSVEDGEGEVRFEQTFAAAGDLDRRLEGARGDWTLRLETTQFAGKVTARLAC